MATIEDVLLPTRVRPTLYRLRIQPDLVQCTFEGEVSIDLAIKEPTNELVLHCVDLALWTIKVTATRPGDVPRDWTILCYKVDKTAQTLAITLQESLEPGWAATLNIKYSGVLGDSLCGFYRSAYKVRHCLLEVC